MTMISTRELLIFLLLVGPIWFLNHYLVSSGTFTRIIRDNTDLGEGFRLPDSSMENADELSRLYDAIYGSSGTLVESGNARTFLWLIFAMLLNLICITIELQLFQEQIGE